MVRCFLLSAAWLLAAVCAAPTAFAQDPVPTDEEAELVFTQALQAFEDGDYGMAYRRFRLVYARYPLNRKTTAALLMAGKALYRDGEYARAAEVLDELIAAYPTSGYVDDARRVRAYARQYVDGTVPEVRMVNLGIVLPQDARSGPLTQALFNGVRIAVDALNEAPGDVLVQMHFRDSGDGQAAAAQAVTSLVAAGADAIIGPLYSDEARAAGARAEAAGVVMMAPLATDEEVSQGRRYVFQANPTFEMRGRLAARYAVDDLGLDRAGVAAEIDEYGERMAEAFQDEALLLGAEVPVFRRLDGPDAWADLGAELGEAPAFDALYLPITGGRSQQGIARALASLDSLGLVGDLRVLGSAEWQGLGALADEAARYGTTYTDEFYPGPVDEEEQVFIRRYRQLADETPTGQAQRLAYTGYDVARYLLGAIAENPEVSVREAIHAAEPFQGIGVRLHFPDGTVNEAMYYLRYTDDGAELVR